MESALRPLSSQLGFEFEVLDVDASPALLTLYDERVPVLLHGRFELCHYFLDITKVRDYLGEIG